MNLVEAPVPILGKFDESFLELPKDLLIMVSQFGADDTFSLVQKQLANHFFVYHLLIFVNVGIVVVGCHGGKLFELLSSETKITFIVTL